mmetsp:Transcript_14380/g.54240  ORF Transcript_14380/g.54240 Transcript_14380/m.54240 type:complete len:274 (+) Transcript_14380:126-947(+)
MQLSPRSIDARNGTSSSLPAFLPFSGLAPLDSRRRVGSTDTVGSVGLAHHLRRAEGQRREANAKPREVDRVLHEHGDGHRPDTSRDGRDGRRYARARLIVTVSNQAVAALARGVLLGVDSHIDDNRPRLEPLALDELGLANRGDDDVCPPDLLRHVLRPAVAHGDGPVLGLQQMRHGHAHDVAAAQHHAVLATDGDVVALEQLDAASRRARHGERRIASAEAQVADVERREAVGVLLHGDLLQDGGLVDLRRQRQLHQNRVHLRVVVELLHLF